VYQPSTGFGQQGFILFTEISNNWTMDLKRMEARSTPPPTHTTEISIKYFKTHKGRNKPDGGKDKHKVRKEARNQDNRHHRAMW
jgi:hypothetical protein